MAYNKYRGSFKRKRRMSALAKHRYNYRRTPWYGHVANSFRYAQARSRNPNGRPPILNLVGNNGAGPSGVGPIRPRRVTYRNAGVAAPSWSDVLQDRRRIRMGLPPAPKEHIRHTINMAPFNGTRKESGWHKYNNKPKRERVDFKGLANKPIYEHHVERSLEAYSSTGRQSISEFILADKPFLNASILAKDPLTDHAAGQNSEFQNRIVVRKAKTWFTVTNTSSASARVKLLVWDCKDSNVTGTSPTYYWEQNDQFDVVDTATNIDTNRRSYQEIGALPVVDGQLAKWWKCRGMTEVDLQPGDTWNTKVNAGIHKKTKTVGQMYDPSDHFLKGITTVCMFIVHSLSLGTQAVADNYGTKTDINKANFVPAQVTIRAAAVYKWQVPDVTSIRKVVTKDNILPTGTGVDPDMRFVTTSETNREAVTTM